MLPAISEGAFSCIICVQASDSSVAAAEMLAIPSSDTGDDVSIYQLKWVEWKEDFAPIVVQVGCS